MSIEFLLTALVVVLLLGTGVIYTIGLAGVFMFMAFAVFVVYGTFASYARDYVIQKPSVIKWIKRSFAGTFGFLGARLAVVT